MAIILELKPKLLNQGGACLPVLVPSLRGLAGPAAAVGGGCGCSEQVVGAQGRL